MKNASYLLLLSFLLVCSCDKNNPEQINPNLPSKGNIISPEFYKGVLFAVRVNFQVKTNETGKFQVLNSDTNGFSITETGIIKAVPSPRTPQKIQIIWDDKSSMQFYIVFSDELETSEQLLLGWKNIENLFKNEAKYAIVLRHADADVGNDFYFINNAPVEWWKSCDSKVARQLNAQGKSRSVQLGKIFINNKIPVGKVMASEFCRAKSTAELMNLPQQIVIDSRLNHSYEGFNGPTHKTMSSILLENVADKKPLLVVSHAEIRLPISPDPVFGWTDCYLLKVENDKSVSFQGAVPFSNWVLWDEIQNKK